MTYLVTKVTFVLYEFDIATFSYRLCENIRKHKEDFARVAPYTIGDILHCFQEFPPVHPAVKANLLSAMRYEWTDCSIRLENGLTEFYFLPTENCSTFATGTRKTFLPRTCPTERKRSSSRRWTNTINTTSTAEKFSLLCHKNDARVNCNKIAVLNTDGYGS